jgi:hypothetical protein
MLFFEGAVEAGGRRGGAPRTHAPQRAHGAPGQVGVRPPNAALPAAGAARGAHERRLWDEGGVDGRTVPLLRRFRRGVVRQALLARPDAAVAARGEAFVVLRAQGAPGVVVHKVGLDAVGAQAFFADGAEAPVGRAHVRAATLVATEGRRPGRAVVAPGHSTHGARAVVRGGGAAGARLASLGVGFPVHG